jgi:hypothetical protein
MIGVGDLVKRIAVLSVANDEFGWVLTDEFPDDVGIIISVEFPSYQYSDGEEEEIMDIGCFVYVLWQRAEYGGPVWHWSEELQVISK